MCLLVAFFLLIKVFELHQIYKRGWLVEVTLRLSQNVAMGIVFWCKPFSVLKDWVEQRIVDELWSSDCRGYFLAKLLICQDWFSWVFLLKLFVLKEKWILVSISSVASFLYSVVKWLWDFYVVDWLEIVLIVILFARAVNTMFLIASFESYFSILISVYSSINLSLCFLSILACKIFSFLLSFVDFNLITAYHWRFCLRKLWRFWRLVLLWRLESWIVWRTLPFVRILLSFWKCTLSWKTQSWKLLLRNLDILLVIAWLLDDLLYEDWLLLSCIAFLTALIGLACNCWVTKWQLIRFFKNGSQISFLNSAIWDFLKKLLSFSFDLNFFFHQ